MGTSLEDQGKGKPGSVLFMCSQNTVRSPMAASLARLLFPSGTFFASAGVREGLFNPFVTEVMAEKAQDLSHHVPQAFDNLDDTYFDLIVALSPAAYEKATAIAKSQSVDIEHWPIADATSIQGRRSIILDAYRAVRDDLSARIVARFDGN